MDIPDEPEPSDPELDPERWREYPEVELNPALVARVQVMADAGLSLRVISGMLEKEGILNAQGCPYSPSSIKSMVDSPAPDVETQARAIGITEDAISLYRQGRLTKEQLLTIPLKG